MSINIIIRYLYMKYVIYIKMQKELAYIIRGFCKKKYFNFSKLIYIVLIIKYFSAHQFFNNHVNFAFFGILFENVIF